METKDGLNRRDQLWEYFQVAAVSEIKEKSTIKIIFETKGENYFRKIEKNITLEMLKKII